jgi:signal recognition particle subunit SRP54
VVILDTAGRLHIDEDLMDELARVRAAAKPTNVLLVLDAMTGQEAVNVAQAFQERVAFDGVVLTKLDGDARGGAALSVRAVTGKPIKYVSVGEKLDQLEEFHPERMASRILGMGDVLTLIEKAEQQLDREEAEADAKRMMSGKFTFEDFLKQMQMLKRMGPLSGLLGMIPGLNKQLQGTQIDDRMLGRVEAMVTSMTPQEQRNPKLLQNASRVRRVARGAGTTQQEVQKLVKQFNEMQKMMRQMGKGGVPKMPRMPF